ncbi:MAG TPA: hypothetical protein PLU72_15335 [Candidatus Ozemobacteraceae bacterium]|nr:hypothetical protein [Candidatus Ozemobacteraceae bacterium]
MTARLALIGIVLVLAGHVLLQAGAEMTSSMASGSPPAAATEIVGGSGNGEADDAGEATGTAAAGFPEKPLAPGEWEPFVEMDSQIFPSYIFATALLKTDEEPSASSSRLLGDRYGLLGVSVCSPRDNAKIRVELKPNAIMDAVVFEGALPFASQTYWVYPQVIYNYDAVKERRQAAPFNVVFSVSIDGAPPQVKAKTVMLRSVNDCVYGFVSADDGSYEDHSYMFAAYVNENHPMVDRLLKEALDTKAVQSFDGYISGSQETVLDQVYAIWLALQKRGIRYSSITTPSAHSDIVQVQNVRFIEESVGNAQANCVDGCVLMASMLYKIGIKPFLVILEDHAYLGIYLDEAKETFVCLETTMLSQGKGRGFFDSVIEETTAEYLKNEQKFEEDTDPNFQIIDIEDARRLGITPIVSPNAAR